MNSKKKWVPKDLEPLREAIADAIASHLKAYDVPSYVEDQLQLAGGEESEAFSSKRMYVRKRLPSDRHDLIDIASRILSHFDDLDLEQALAKLQNATSPAVSELTRQKLIRILSDQTPISGHQDLLEFLSRIVPIHRLGPNGTTRLEAVPDTTDPWGLATKTRTLADDIVRHCVHNDDWSTEYLLQRIGVKTMSFERLCLLLEQVVHPLARDDGEQASLVEALNATLMPDGYHLTVVATESGHSIYGVRKAGKGVPGTAKNLIFASVGPKPRIIIRDSVNNDIEVVENRDSCLIYDRPLKEHGLYWEELVQWWRELEGLASVEDARKQLGRRLLASLQSPPERALFEQYFWVARRMFQREIPALIPQVYLHYDPFTKRELSGHVALARQRMDFLLLLPHRRRIVLEVDGAQHYSHSGRPRPDLYATMVAEDRVLRLAGYEVFRFGATELTPELSPRTVDQFFMRALASAASV